MLMKRTRGWSPFIFILIVSLVLVSSVSAQTFEHIKKQVKEHTLSNGMKFIVLERHEAPVVSFHTYADVGSVNETYGITGISHLLEHMAFKGTKIIGTTDYEAEAVVLARLDSIYSELTRERHKGAEVDSTKLVALEEDFETTRKQASGYVINNDFFDLLMEAGGRGLNAYTNTDATQYICSLPSNKVELWMATESDRFLNFVPREFYKERDVVMEERRLGVETQPTGRLLEEFLSVAFKAHPYHHMVVGHMSDLRSITRQDVINYFKKYYIPSNMVVAVVGDVKAEEIFKMAETYFGRVPSGPKPEPVRTVEPPQQGERRVQVEAKSQPILAVGYHRPDVRHKDGFVLDAMSNIIGQGRSSRLYRTLVKEKKIAVQTGAFSGFPGVKYPNLILFFAIPAKDHTSEECLEAIDQEIERIKTELVSEEELTKFKRTAKKNLINSWKSNSSMARVLTNKEVIMGDWRSTFDEIQRYEAVTAEDIQRVANTYLVKKNRTIGEIIPEEETSK